jgi:hypothetical protein
MIYHQNQKAFDTLEVKIVSIFNKNTEVLKNKIKDSTG